MNTYTEFRLIVKYRNQKSSTHVGNVADPVKWVLSGRGPEYYLGEDRQYIAPVEWVKVVEFNGYVGFPAKRGTEHVFLRNRAEA
jgi:hypothetical protein